MPLRVCVSACLYTLHIYLERHDSNANDLISSVSRNYLLRFTQGKRKDKRQETKAKAEAREHKQQLEVQTQAEAEAQAEDEHTAKEKKNQ